MDSSCEFDPQRASQLIAYISSKVNVGKVKLMKLIYLSDFIAYEKLGKPITNDMYKNWPKGPVPEGIFFGLEEMSGSVFTVTPKQFERNGEIYEYEKFEPGATFDMSLFTQDQRQIIDGVLLQYGSMSTNDFVELVHEEAPYKMTQAREEIPYYLAPLRCSKQLTPEEIQELQSNKEYLDSVFACIGEP